MIYGLTRRQTDLLRYLAAAQRQGLSPSYDEMAAALGLKSKSGIHRMVEALATRGAIRRLPHRARTIALVEHVTTDDDPEPTNPEIIALLEEAQRSAQVMFGSNDMTCTCNILAVWLWHAVRGSSPGFIAK